MDVKPVLVSITRGAAEKNTQGGDSPLPPKTTYYRGDPVFDEYEKAMKAKIPSGVTLPKNFMGPGAICSTGSATELLPKLSAVLEQYHRGLADVSAVERTMSNIVADLRSSYIDLGFDPSEFMPKLIADVYDVARIDNISGAHTASWYDSRPLVAAQNGHTRNTHDWIYYDSKYYYASEDMKGTLLFCNH